MVSIIMPTYNRAYIIEQAIQSVQRQTYEDWELIIVDDASNDHTQQLLGKYIGPKIHYYVNAMNQGANASRNRGAAYAKGEYLAFLDSDNYWPDNKLEIQMRMAQEYQGQRCFFYGRVQITNGEEVRIVPETLVSSKELKEGELYGNVVDTNTIFVAKSLFWETGGFEERLPRIQDWEIVLRFLFCFNLEAIGCEEILSFNTIQKNSISNNEESNVIALGFLIEKYFSRYLSEKEIVNYLLGFNDYVSVPPILIGKTIRKACNHNPMIFSEMLFRLEMYGKKIQEDLYVIGKKNKMEALLYNWHRKSVESENGNAFSKYFCVENGIQNIAIYGLGKLGSLFYEDVKRLPIKIAYGIDQKKENFNGLPIKRPQDILTAVDLIVVAVLENAEEIKADLEKNYKGEIVTLIEVLQSI